MFELASPDFFLALEPKARRIEGDGGPYLDWIDCAIRLEVPCFTAQIAWACMPHELEQFKHALEEINEKLTPGMSANLNGVERNFELRLSLTDLGGLMGAYKLQSDLLDSGTLTGQFGIDQSYLPGMIQGLARLINFQHS